METIIKWCKTWRAIPVLSWIRGAKQLTEGNYQLAAYYYKRGLERHRSHPARLCARMDYAYCLFRAGDLEGSEKELLGILEQEPGLREASMRLARLYLWMGKSHEAAWVLNRALKRVAGDAELVSYFLIASLDEGPAFLRSEAISALLDLDRMLMSNPLVEVARACLAIHRGDRARGRAVLAGISAMDNAPLEVYLAFAEILHEEGKLAHSRHQLRRALLRFPEHPRLLSLLAATYMEPGAFYNPDYAVQLATAACRSCGWLSPRELHILAQSYYHSGDKISALMIASKAKDLSAKRGVAGGKKVGNLDELLAVLSTGTLA